MFSVTSMACCQRELSIAQSTFLIGPIVASPVKAVISLAQLITGLACGIIFGALTILSQNDWCAENTLEAMGHVGLGCVGFGYSMVNILTLGVASRLFENAICDLSDESI